MDGRCECVDELFSPQVGGILNLSSQISGIAAPIVTGYLVYARHSFTMAFFVAGGYLVLGICAYLFLLRDVRGISFAAPAETL